METGTRTVLPRDPCEIAFGNVRQGVDVDCTLPRNVFEGDWSEHLFFDAGWMTTPQFVDHVKAFLDLEGGRCACLWKLDSEVEDEPRVFFVREQTTADEYLALLAGKVPGWGWLDAMERLACASDVGEWCMYCEPMAELAVIAFRHEGAAVRYSCALSRFGAERIDPATAGPLSYVGALLAAALPAWREALVREYAVRPL